MVKGYLVRQTPSLQMSYTSSFFPPLHVLSVITAQKAAIPWPLASPCVLPWLLPQCSQAHYCEGISSTASSESNELWTQIYSQESEPQGKHRRLLITS